VGENCLKYRMSVLAAGVRTMAYAQNLLLTGGFEFEILGWDVANREQTVVLKGHKHSVLQASARGGAGGGQGCPAGLWGDGSR
jgi:hypothetical protein